MFLVDQLAEIVVGLCPGKIVGSFREEVIIDIAQRDDVLVIEVIYAEARLVGSADKANVQLIIRRLSKTGAREIKSRSEGKTGPFNECSPTK